MFKRLLTALFLVVGSFCFSGEFQNDFLEEFQQWESQSLFHIGRGNGYLLMNRPHLALEAFQKAYSVIDKSSDSSEVMYFLILLGRTVAYDCLGLDAYCKQSIGEMFLVLNSFEDEEEEEETSFLESQSLQRESASYNFIANFFYEVVSRAPTPEVRHLLFSLVEEIAEELVFTCGLEEDLSVLETEDWDEF